MTKIPRPQVRRAILRSAGYTDPTFTEHKYVETRLCTLDHGDGEAYEHIFRCLITGAERRWGTARIEEVN